MLLEIVMYGVRTRRSAKINPRAVAGVSSPPRRARGPRRSRGVNSRPRAASETITRCRKRTVQDSQKLKQQRSDAPLAPRYPGSTENFISVRASTGVPVWPASRVTLTTLKRAFSSSLLRRRQLPRVELMQKRTRAMGRSPEGSFC